MRIKPGTSRIWSKNKRLFNRCVCVCVCVCVWERERERERETVIGCARAYMHKYVCLSVRLIGLSTICPSCSLTVFRNITTGHVFRGKGKVTSRLQLLRCPRSGSWSLERWDLGFEPYWGHGCYVLFFFCPLLSFVDAPWEGPASRSRSPPESSGFIVGCDVCV
jgi:hypothetical protein